MTAVHASIDLPVPPRQVWDVIMDPRRFSDWVTIHRKLGRTDEGALRTGFQVEQTLALHHAPFKVHWTLGEHEIPRRAVWEGRGPGGSHARIVNDLTELPDGGTHFEYSNEFENPGGLLGRVASRVLVVGVAEREANRSLERLKALLERGR
jgi:carbon monoxide dehydrogenase subunit G